MKALIYSQTPMDERESFLAKFFQFGEDIHKNSYQKVLPLLHKHMGQETDDFILIYKNENPVLRASFHLHKVEQDIAYAGLLAFDMEKMCTESQALLKSSWLTLLASSKRKILVGPVDFNNWLDHRIEDQESTVTFNFDPKTPQCYGRVLEEMGFSKGQKYKTYLFNNFEKSFTVTQIGYKKAIEKGFEFKQLIVEDENDVHRLYDLNTTCFKNNYLYSDVTFEQYRDIILKSALQVKMDYSFLISKENKDYGYIYAFEENDYLIIKTILILPEAQSAGLASAMLHKVELKARENGLSKIGGAMVRDGNVSGKFFDHIGKPNIEKTYSLYQMEAH